MRKLLCLCLIMFDIISYAQESRLRIAILDPVINDGSIQSGMQITVREIVSSAIVNMGQFQVVERSLIDQVMQEQAFTNSGVVDDAQATELGKLVGANKVVVSIVTQVNNQIMLSLKLLDVKTATIESQQVKVLSNDTFLTAIEPMTKALCCGSGNGSSQNGISVEKKTNVIQQNEIVINMPAGGYVPDNKIDEVLYVYLDGEFVGKAKITKGFSFSTRLTTENYGADLAAEMESVTAQGPVLIRQDNSAINQLKAIKHMIRVYDKYQVSPKLSQRDLVFTHIIYTDDVRHIEIESVPKGKKKYAIELVSQK